MADLKWNPSEQNHNAHQGAQGCNHGSNRAYPVQHPRTAHGFVELFGLFQQLSRCLMWRSGMMIFKWHRKYPLVHDKLSMRIAWLCERATPMRGEFEVKKFRFGVREQALSESEDAFRAFEFGQIRGGAGGEGVLLFHGGSLVGGLADSEV